MYRKHTYIRSSSTIIGEYFFKEYLESHSWFKPPEQKSFLSSPYCLPGKKRQLHTSQLFDLSSLDKPSTSDNTIQIHSSGHFLNADISKKGITPPKLTAKLEVLYF